MNSYAMGRFYTLLIINESTSINDIFKSFLILASQLFVQTPYVFVFGDVGIIFTIVSIAIFFISNFNNKFKLLRIGILVTYSIYVFQHLGKVISENYVGTYFMTDYWWHYVFIVTLVVLLIQIVFAIISFVVADNKMQLVKTNSCFYGIMLFVFYGLMAIESLFFYTFAYFFANLLSIPYSSYLGIMMGHDSDVYALKNIIFSLQPIFRLVLLGLTLVLVIILLVLVIRNTLLKKQKNKKQNKTAIQ